MVSWWVRSPRRGTSALWPKIQNPKLPQPFGNSLGCAGTVGWSGAHQDPELISEWRYIRLTVLQGTLGHEFLLPISSELPEHILWSINCEADKVILCNSTCWLWRSYSGILSRCPWGTWPKSKRGLSRTWTSGLSPSRWKREMEPFVSFRNWMLLHPVTGTIGSITSFRLGWFQT